MPQSGIKEYLKNQRCYDLLPVSYKSIVLDGRLGMTKALLALLQNGLISAPIWQSDKQSIGDGWTLLASDFIGLLSAAEDDGDDLDSRMARLSIQQFLLDHVSSLKGDGGHSGERRHATVDAMTDLLAASQLLAANSSLHNLILQDLNDSAASAPFVGLMDRQRILKFIAVNYTNLRDLCVPLETLKPSLGTWTDQDPRSNQRQLITVNQETPLKSVLELFTKYKVESLPIVDQQGRLVDVCDQYDLVSRIPAGLGRSMNDLLAPISQLIDQWKAGGREGREGGGGRGGAAASNSLNNCCTCTLQTTVQSLLETIRLASEPISRFFVLSSSPSDNGSVCGVISVHDILRYFLIE